MIRKRKIKHEKKTRSQPIKNKRNHSTNAVIQIKWLSHEIAMDIEIEIVYGYIERC